MEKIEKAKPKKGFIDTFNFFMIKHLTLDRQTEMPIITRYNGPIPKKLISYVKKNKDRQNCFVHHYLYDRLFDGRNGVWYGCQEKGRGIQKLINKYNQYEGIISTDFSIYVDLPLPAQIWNIYRDRVMCMCYAN